jgi:DNA-binding beta-propeller fold protein YncE
VTEAEASEANEAIFMGPSPLNGGLTKWLLDEANGYIYAIVDNQTLKFFDMNTLELKKEMKFSSISDISLYNGKLYAALEKDKQIAVINIKTAVVEKKMILKYHPDKIAFGENKLFYSQRHYSGWELQNADYTKLHVLNLADEKESAALSLKTIPGYEVYSDAMEITDLKVDPVSQVLYVSTDHLNYDKSFVFSMSTADYQVLDAGKPEGFSGYNLKLFVTDKDIFFGSYRMKKENLSKSYGDYEGRVFFVKGDYVLSQGGLFDRESFIKLGSFSNQNDPMGGYWAFLVDSKNNVYMHQGLGMPISKGILSNFNNFKVVNGTENPNIPEGIIFNADIMGAGSKDKRLNITKWMIDPERKMIYAISKENHSLMLIGMEDLKLKKQFIIGKSPGYMAMSGDKLYVALTAINQVAVVDLKTQALEKNILLEHKPAALAIEGSKLFYMGYEPYDRTTDQYFKLYMHDLATQKELDVLGNSHTEFLESNMVLDAEQHRLYLGHASHDAVKVISTLNYKLLDNNSGSGYDSYGALVSLDKDVLIYSRTKMDSQKLSTIYGYFKEHIIYIKDSYAFSTKAVYDVNTFEKLTDLPIESDTIYMDDKNHVMMFNKESNTIKRFALLPMLEGFEQAYNESVKNTDYSIPRSVVEDLGRIMGNMNIAVDDKNDLIYAVSPGGNKLQVIGAKDLKLKKELILGQGLADLKLYKDKLYIAVKHTNSIAVFDTASQSISQTYALTDSPQLIEVDDQYIYYKGSTKMASFNLITKKEEDFAFYNFKWEWNVYNIDSFFVDAENSILYGDTKESDPREGLYAISLLDRKPVKLPTENSNNIVKFNGVTVFEGNELLYGAASYDRSNYMKVNNKFKGAILYADDKYIITNLEMYLRKSHEKLGDLPEFLENLKFDEKGNFYIVNNREHYIKKTTLENMLLNLKNKTAAYEAYKKSEFVDAPKPEVKVTFNDIDKHWAKADIEALADIKIVKGIGDSFVPEKHITRAEYVMMLIRAMELENFMDIKGDIEAGVFVDYFTDVKRSDWYFESTVIARRIGLVMGNEKHQYLPNKQITREEMAVMTLRAMAYKRSDKILRDNAALNIYNDKDRISSWARMDSASAVKMGLITGKPGMLFAPEDKSTRAEAAVIVRRLMGKF